MLAALHIVIGVLTPHLGTIFSGFFALLKARQDIKLQALKTDQELKEKQIEEKEKEMEEEVEEDRIEHEKPSWADRIAPVTKLIVVLAVLGLFAYAEFSGSTWEDDWRQGMVNFVLAHAMSQSVLSLRKFRNK